MSLCVLCKGPLVLEVGAFLLVSLRDACRKRWHGYTSGRHERLPFPRCCHGNCTGSVPSVVLCEEQRPYLTTHTIWDMQDKHKNAMQNQQCHTS